MALTFAYPRKTVFWIPLAAWGVLFLTPAITYGDEKAKHPTSLAEHPSSLSIDTIDSDLTRLKSPKYRLVKNILASLKAKKWDSVLTQVSQNAKKLAHLQDYLIYFKGEAVLGKVRAKPNGGPALLKKVQDLEKEITAFLQAHGSVSLARKLQILNAELILEEALLKLNVVKKGAQKKLDARRQAILALEDGFQRLQKLRVLVLALPLHIKTYSTLCEDAEDSSPGCETWITKLAPNLEKGSEDELAVKKSLATRQRFQLIAQQQKLKLQAQLQPDLTDENAPKVDPTSTIVNTATATSVATTPPKPKTPTVVQLQGEAFSKGFFLYLAGDYTSAYAAWNDLQKEYPEGIYKLRTKFWMGRAAQRTDHPKQMETFYKEIIQESPFSYYALLASWFGKISLGRMISGELPEISRLPGEAPAQEIAKIQRAEQFIANDLHELAQVELKDVKILPGYPDSFLIYLAYLHHLANNHRQAYQIYAELKNRRNNELLSSFGAKLVFPFTYWKLIKKASQTINVNPLIPISIIKQESAFDHEAMSAANAFGLMQLIRPTARSLDPKITVMGLLEPEKNVPLGTRYISEMLKRYKQNLILSLAAYNAGPSNADRWRREISPTLPSEEYIELISFKETREYVQSIVRNVFWYVKLKKHEEIPNIDDIVNVDRLPKDL